MNGANRAPPWTSLRAALVGSPVQKAFLGCHQPTGENAMQWEIEKIIAVAKQLQRTGSSPASTGERIAAAFVLNRPEYLPAAYTDMLEAWDRLDEEWQQYIRLIKRDYLHLVETE